MNRRIDAAEIARGRWRDILAILGVPAAALSGRHVACPLCGGKDRFRFDDKEGRGSWICNQEGAGDGFHLLMRLNGWDFREAARQVEAVVAGGVRAAPIPKPTTPEAKRESCRKLWKAARPVCEGDPVARYLSGRALAQDRYPPALRTLPLARVKGGGEHPCMIALVQGDGGATLHRTYLASDGDGKAGIEAPRRLMPGDTPENASVRLWPPQDGRLGVAEGIETAMAATRLFGVPCWALVNTALMAKWRPPAGVSEVVVFGDSDSTFGGHAAAYALAHRLAVSGVVVDVRMPDGEDEDWNDVLMRRA